MKIASAESEMRRGIEEQLYAFKSEVMKKKQRLVELQRQDIKRLAKREKSLKLLINVHNEVKQKRSKRIQKFEAKIAAH